MIYLDLNNSINNKLYIVYKRSEQLAGKSIHSIPNKSLFINGFIWVQMVGMGQLGWFLISLCSSKIKHTIVVTLLNYGQIWMISDLTTNCTQFKP